VIKILAIETTCDETAAAVVQDGSKVISNVVYSQIPVHKKYGGVVPELASRQHLEAINEVIRRAIEPVGFSDISAVGFSRGPGLIGSLLVGSQAARTICFLKKLPLIAVNHLEGHLFSAKLTYPDLQPPFLGLVVSGGHTELVKVENYGKYKLLGATRDDAAGEAFDKVAKLLGLGYPGGPAIEKISVKGNPQKIKFPRPYLAGSYDFSFSGLKTAVYYFWRDRKKSDKISVADVAASFQNAVVDTLVEKLRLAAASQKIKKIVLGGGVVANSRLREKIAELAKKEKLKVYLPELPYCLDNAAMIGAIAYHYWRKKIFADLTVESKPDLRWHSWNH